MKSKLIFSTENNDTTHWIDLPFVPRKDEWFNVIDIINKEEQDAIWQTAQCWSGIHGIIQSVEYRHNDKEFYVEVYIWCED